MNYSDLLREVRAVEPYCHWREVGIGKYRDYREDDNPNIELSVFGLWSWKEERVVESLVSVARNCGIKVKGIGKRNSRSLRLKNPKQIAETKTEGSAARAKKQAWLMKELGDTKKWKKTHWPKIQSYFVEEREIPKSLVTWRDYWRMGCCVQKLKDKVEIVVPLWSREQEGEQEGGQENGEQNGERELVQLHKINLAKNATPRKKLQFKRNINAAVLLGRLDADRVMIVEGVEDALSILAALRWEKNKEKETKKKTDCDWAIVAVCGASGFAHCWDIISSYEVKVVLVDPDNNGAREYDKMGAGLRGSLALEDRVMRYMGVEGKDANEILRENKKEEEGEGQEEAAAVWQWLKETSKPENYISWEGIVANKKESEEEELREAEAAPEEWSWGNSPVTDLAAARAVVTRYGERIRCSEDGRWWCWNGKVWAENHAEGRIRSWIASIGPLYLRLAAEWKRLGTKNDDEIDQVRRFAALLSNSSRQSAIMRCLAGLPKIQCEIADFNSQEFILNTPTGVVDLKQGRLLPHDSAYLCSKITNIGYRPGAMKKSVLWAGFLAHASAGDVEWREWFQRAMGYSLSGSSREKCLFFAWGLTDTGKSTFSEAFMQILGDYAAVAPIDILTGTDNGQNSSDYKKAMLCGARFVATSETKSKTRISPEMIKDLTGGDTIFARLPGYKGFSYRPTYKIWIRGNTAPSLVEADNAVFQRLRILEFLNPFTGESKDVDFRTKLAQSTTELEAMLAWAVEGAVSAFNSEDGVGVFVSENTKELIELWRDESPEGLISRFVKELCTHEEGYSVSATDMYKSFKTWLVENEMPVLAPMTFFKLSKTVLSDEGFVQVKPKNVKTWINCRMDDSEFTRNPSEEYLSGNWTEIDDDDFH